MYNSANLSFGYPYVPSNASYSFRNAYIKNSRLYLTGYFLQSSTYYAWIASSNVDSIDTIEGIGSTDAASAFLSMINATGITISSVSVSKFSTIQADLHTRDTLNETQQSISVLEYTNNDITTYYDEVAFLGYAIDLENISLPISLPCSMSGNTNLSYSITQYQAYTVPSWVTLDSSSQILNVSTPSVAGQYQFYINTSSSFYANHILTTIEIVNCTIKDCIK